MQAKQEKILAEAIKLVPFDGWSRHVLRVAAKNCGLDERYANVAFSNGAIDAVRLFLGMISAETFASINMDELRAMKVRERIFHILQSRFMVMRRHKAAIRKTMQFLAMPQNLGASMRLAWEMASGIWYAAGDNSVDFNYYTKRLTLIAVYSSTLLVWLEDNQPDGAETMSFLRHRIENVMQFETLKGRIKKKCRMIAPNNCLQ